MMTYIGELKPSWLTWKIDAKGSLRYVKIVIKSSVPVCELLNKNDAFLNAWVPDLESTLLAESDDADVSGVYILKDGSVFIGFEIPSQFTTNYWFYAPVRPQKNLGITIEVYCQRNKLTDRYTIYFDEYQTKLVEYSNFDNDHPTEMRTLPLEVDRNLKLVEDWPPKP